jgi:hypothetical protein
MPQAAVNQIKKEGYNIDALTANVMYMHDPSGNFSIFRFADLIMANSTNKTDGIITLAFTYQGKGIGKYDLNKHSNRVTMAISTHLGVGCANLSPEKHALVR